MTDHKKKLKLEGSRHNKRGFLGQRLQQVFGNPAFGVDFDKTNSREEMFFFLSCF